MRGGVASASVVSIDQPKGVGEPVEVGGEPGSAPVELGHAAGRRHDRGGIRAMAGLAGRPS
jgi:hypothetical protein